MIPNPNIPGLRASLAGSPRVIPTVPSHPDGISHGGTVSYCGPPRDELPLLMIAARTNHATSLGRAAAARRLGQPWHAARHLFYARMARQRMADLLRYQRALDTMWAERSWYPYPQYEARRAALIKAGLIRP